MSQDARASLAAGADLPSRVVGPLSQTDVLRFAGASGDFNPLHWDPELASRTGFEAPVAMGQYTAAILSAWVTDTVGIERLRVFEIRFVAPVLVGDTLRLTGRVQADDEDSASTVQLVLEATTANGVVARATAVVDG